MIRRARWFELAAVAALSVGVAQAQVVPFTGQVLNDFVNAVQEGVDRAVDPSGQDLPLPADLAENASGYDIDEVRVSYDRGTDTLYVGIKTFGIAGDVDGDGDPGRTSPELGRIGGVDSPHFGPPECFAFMIDFDEDGVFDIIAGVPFLGVIDPNNLERREPGADDGMGFNVAEFVGGRNAALAPGAAFGGPVDQGWSLHASPNGRQPDLEFELRGFSQLAAEYQSGLAGPDRSNIFRIDVYMGSAGDAVGEDFLHGGLLQDPPDNPPPALCPEGLREVETCNDFDDDCDDLVDEGPLFRMVDGEAVPFEEIVCDTGLPGVCGVGTPDCRGGEELCIPNVRPGAQVEVCNGVDDDCDGNVDEDTALAPLPEVGDACDSGEFGLCSEGTQNCIEGALACEPNGDPIAELCNGSDDDCDGPVDEDFAGLGDACMNGVGACAREGVVVCAEDQMGIDCEGPPPGDPAPEMCNGVDDDCNGSTDEVFEGLGTPCTVGVGECAGAGMTVCAAGGMETECNAEAAPECCGNGAVDAGEDCDDGNAVPDDGCTLECASCGNGTCDDGETDASCPQDCPECGDGICEEGETSETCPEDCPPIDPDGECGDGVCDPNESNSFCPNDCPAICGNSIVETGESCDDGNVLDGDSCPANCRSPDGGVSDRQPRLTGADITDNCSVTRPGGGSAAWLLLIGLPVLLRRRPRV